MHPVVVLLVLGETHGVRETPSIVYALAVELGARGVAFEWSHEEMDAPLQAFVRAGAYELEELWSLPRSAEFFCRDGRITAGHFRPAREASRRRLARPGDCVRPPRFGASDGLAGLRTDPRAGACFKTPRGVGRADAHARGHRAFHAQLESVDGKPMAAHLAERLPGLRPAMLQHEPGPPMPPAPIVLRVGEATAAVVPGQPSQAEA